MKEIKFKDVKPPWGLDKNIIDENSDSNKFIINEPIGSNFFPKHRPTTFRIILAILIGVASFYFFTLMGEILYKILKINHCLSILILWMLLFFVVYIVSKFTSNKTQLTFSINGIDVHSRSGSLFIPKDNVENVFVKETQNVKYKNKNIQYDVSVKCKKPEYIQYDIIIKIKQPLHNPYLKEDKIEIKLLQEFKIKSYFFYIPDLKYKDIENTRNFTYYIVQEIKRALDLIKENKEKKNDL